MQKYIDAGRISAGHWRENEQVLTSIIYVHSKTPFLSSAPISWKGVALRERSSRMCWICFLRLKNKRKNVVFFAIHSGVYYSKFAPQREHVDKQKQLTNVNCFLAERKGFEPPVPLTGTTP